MSTDQSCAAGPVPRVQLARNLDLDRYRPRRVLHWTPTACDQYDPWYDDTPPRRAMDDDDITVLMTDDEKAQVAALVLAMVQS